MFVETAKRHPEALYFVITFLISWGGCLPVFLPVFLHGTSLEIEDLFVPGMFIVGGPFLTGLLMTSFVGGRAGLRELFGRMFKWNVGARWYAPILIFPILLFLTGYILSKTVSPELAPTFFAPGIIMGLVAGFLEEVGWMGFAYPMMRSKMGVFRATMWLAFIHALWHFLPDFLNNYGTRGLYWVPYFIGFFVFVMGLRVLIVWVYENTESLLLAQLMHASSTGFYGILVPTDLSPQNWAIFSCVYAVLLSACALLVLVKYGRNFKGIVGDVNGKRGRKK